MNFKIIKLKFTGPLMLSQGMADYTSVSEILHSDTLKNALWVAFSSLNDQDLSSQDFFNQFLLSSAFPFIGQKLFFPKPFIHLPLQINEEASPGSLSKKLKKLLWLEKPLFENSIAGLGIKVEPTDFSGDGRFLFAPEHGKNNTNAQVYVMEEAQQVSLSHNSEATPFYTTRIRFAPDAGLFVLVYCRDESFFKEILMPAFKLAGDQGTGSYKSLGYGRFQVSFSDSELDLKCPPGSEKQLNLSLYSPTKEEAENALVFSDSSYQLIKRGGFIASPENTNRISWRKKSVYMFREGSVFKTKQPVTGNLLDLQPADFEHPVWREGRAIFVPVQSNDNLP